MAQYVAGADAPRTVLIDFVDVDSAKWVAVRRLALVAAVVGVPARRLAPARVRARRRGSRDARVLRDRCRSGPVPASCAGCVGRIETIGNGVDTEHYAPSTRRFASPFAARIDCRSSSPARWTTGRTSTACAGSPRKCCRSVLRRAAAAPISRSSACGPTRCGAGARRRRRHRHRHVADVRPYLQHAAVVVAPLRVARGIQNKILEAMAMARPVVATDACGAGIDAVNGRRLRDSSVTPPRWRTRSSRCCATARRRAIDGQRRTRADRRAVHVGGAAARCSKRRLRRPLPARLLPHAGLADETRPARSRCRARRADDRRAPWRWRVPLVSLAVALAWIVGWYCADRDG